ncbi:MAG: PH domain-containing protein [Eubacteriaceae bacterium]
MTLRNHKIYILSLFLDRLKSIFVFIIILFANFDFIKLLISFGVVLVTILISIIIWYKTTYYIDDGVLFLEVNMLSKKSNSIPLSKVTTIDTSQNIVLNAIGVVILKIDTSANNKLNEIKLYLKMEDANELINTIHSVGNDVEISLEVEKEFNQNKKIKVSSRELFIYAVLKKNLFLMFGVLFTVVNFLDDFISIFKFNTENVDNNVNIFIDTYVNAFGVLVVIFIIFFSTFLLIKLISIVITMIKYLGFEIERSQNKLLIKYGLINKKKYTFEIERINVLLIKQSFLMQILGLYNIHISAVGYGDEPKEQSILYPVCKKDQIHHILKELLPEYNFEGEIHKVPRKAISMFFVLPIIITMGVTVVFSITVPYGSISFILFPIVLLQRYLSQRNIGIGFSKNLIFSSSGGENKKISVVLAEKIQAMDYKSNYFQRRKNLCTYKLYYFSIEGVSIKHMESIYKEHIEDIMIQ